MGDQQVEGGEKERILRGEENQSTVHICIWRQHNETTKYCAKNVGISWGVKLFKVHCTHWWNYHSEAPILLLCAKIKKKKPSHLTPLHQCLATASWRSLWTQPTSLCVILTILVWPPAAFPLPPCFALACGLSQHQRLLSCFAASFFSATALLLKFLAKSSLTDSYIRSWLISFSGSDLKCPEMH
jgi:hypothetical protein